MQTNRLILRQFENKDYDDLYEILLELKDDEFEGYPDISYESTKNHLAYRLHSEEFLAIELKETHKVIGNIYLGKRDFNSREIGYIISKNYQRKGYAREAVFGVVEYAFSIGVHRIYAELDQRNIASWKLMESTGFRREADLKKNIFFHKDSNGNPIWKDTYIYGLLEEEYYAKTSK